MRLIDAERFEKAQFKRCHRSLPYVGTCSYDRSPLWKEIENAPTVDAEPIRHGEWIESKVGGYDKCSVCRESTLAKYNFCPNCGAKMDGGGMSGND